MSRGGMSHNPFGGFTRPDKLDPRALLPSDASPEQVLLLAVILDAVTNYIFFGLGDEAPDGSPRGNGTCVESFWADFLYLYKIRSYLPETWESARTMRDFCEDETGHKKLRRLTLTDTQLKFMTFDLHWAVVGLKIPMDLFLDQVKARRKQVLEMNHEQVREYIQLMRENSKMRLDHRLTRPMFLSTDVDMRVLLEPRDEKEVQDLVLYLPKSFRERHPIERGTIPFRADRLAASDATAKVYIAKGPLLDDVAA